MPLPPPYDRLYSYTDWSANYPDKPHRGQDLDEEFNAIEAFLDAARSNLDALLRDDGTLEDAIVTINSLAQETLDFIRTEAEGPPGPQGPAGPAVPGPAGQSGPIGEGLEWLVGSGVPSNSIGVLNQLYLNSQNGDVYKKTESGWTLSANLKGPSGTIDSGDHGTLTGLSDPDHPISAVQGLQSELDDINARVNTKPLTYVQATAPAGVIPTGSLWFDSDDQFRLYRYDGVQWNDIDSAYRDAVAADLATALQAASDAQATADGKIDSFVGDTEPASASVGDFWLRTTDNRLHRYDGSAWQPYQDADIQQALQDAAGAQSTADGKIRTFYQPSQPSGADVGDLWFDSDNDNHPYRYNGAQWIDIRDAYITQVAQDASDALQAAQSAQAAADGKIDIYYSNTAPPAPADGDLWVDLDGGNQLYRYNGALSQFESIQDAEIAAAIAAAGNAQTTADGKITAYYQNTAPSASVSDTGDLWYDLDDGNHPYRYNGSSWVSIRDQAIADAQALAQSAYDLAAASGDAFNIYWSSTQPASPAAGDYWYDTTNAPTSVILYRYDGANWDLVRDEAILSAQQTAADANALADEKVRVYIQANDPEAAGDPVDVGDVWFDSDNGNLPRYWNGSAWSSIRDGEISVVRSIAENAEQVAQNAEAIADGKVQWFYQPSAPASPSVGDYWVDDDDPNLQVYRWTGTQWLPVDFNAAAALASNAQATADGKVTAYYRATAPSSAELYDIWVETDNYNRVYICTSVAPVTWTPADGVQGGLTDGQVGQDGIQPGAVTTETALFSGNDTAASPAYVEGQVHATTGGQIVVRALVYRLLTGTTVSGTCTATLQRSVNGGAYATVQSGAVLIPTDDDRTRFFASPDAGSGVLLSAVHNDLGVSQTATVSAQFDLVDTDNADGDDVRYRVRLSGGTADSYSHVASITTKEWKR